MVGTYGDLLDSGSIHCDHGFPVVCIGCDRSNDRQPAGAPVWLQVLVFVVVSAIMLAMLRPLTKKFMNPKIVRTNVDSVVGTSGLVMEAIDNVTAKGQVKLGHMFWTARSTSGEPIAEGALVRVDYIEGVKVFVTPAEVTADVH